MEAINAVIRIPDPNFEGQSLFAGKSIGADGWSWFRVRGFSLRDRKVEQCEVFRAVAPQERERLDDHYNRGGFRLEHFKLGGEIRALIAI